MSRDRLLISTLSISFQSITKDMHLPLLQGRFYIFCRSGDHRFQICLSVQAVHRRPRPAEPESQPDAFILWQRTRIFTTSNSRDPLIPTKSVSECPILVPGTPMFTLSLVLDPGIFHFTVAHIKMWDECPPPPPDPCPCVAFDQLRWWISTIT